jgi:hypothetical protein
VLLNQVSIRGGFQKQNKLLAYFGRKKWAAKQSWVQSTIRINNYKKNS